MRLLLDTQALLWWLSDDARLGRKARSAIAAGTPVVSAASLWEIAIKASLGKLGADVGEVAGAVTAEGMERLGVQDRHLIALQGLPFHHRDPFDRLLVVQATVEKLPLLTSDTTLAAYECTLMAAER